MTMAMTMMFLSAVLFELEPTRVRWEDCAVQGLEH